LSLVAALTSCFNREYRCKSGTVSAAVTSQKNASNLPLFAFADGKAGAGGSQKTCLKLVFMLSEERLE